MDLLKETKGKSIGRRDVVDAKHGALRIVHSPTANEELGYSTVGETSYQGSYASE